MFHDTFKGFYMKKELNYECQKDESFVDIKNNNTLALDDVQCHNPQLCSGQNINKAIDAYLDHNKISDAVKKNSLY